MNKKPACLAIIALGLCLTGEMAIGSSPVNHIDKNSTVDKVMAAWKKNPNLAACQSQLEVYYLGQTLQKSKYWTVLYNCEDYGGTERLGSVFLSKIPNFKYCVGQPGTVIRTGQCPSAKPKP